MNNKDISKLHMIDAISTPYSDDFMKEVNRTLVGMMQPDPYGCEAFFVKTFINEEMQPDFGIIANIFYLNVPEALTFKSYEYYTETSIRSSYPVEAFSLFTLSQILSRAKAGNEFSVQLLKYLYKTYYKKEYKVLKKFKTISPREVMSISEDDEGENIAVMARILTLCPFFGIEKDPKCEVLYAVIDKHNTEDEESIKTQEGPQANIEQFAEMSDIINHIFGLNDLEDIIKASKDYRRYDKFRRNVYKELGFHPDFAEVQEGGVSIGVCYIKTMLILTKMYPGREFTKEELQAYAAVYYDVSTMCGAMDEIDAYYTKMLGEVDDLTIDGSMFDPEEFEKFAGMKIRWYGCEEFDVPDDAYDGISCISDNVGDNKSNQSSPGKGTLNTLDQSSEKPLKQSSGKKLTSGRATQTGALNSDDRATYEIEIDSLRSKLHKKEYDAKHFAELYKDAKKKLEEAEMEKQIYRSEHEELIALREHVYNMTEEDIVIQEKTRREMIEAVRGRKVAIVGGHTNWVLKMKDVFPDWTYINFKSVTTIDDSVLDHIEYVYFFTDFIKHNVYYRFINLVREKEIPFGYISNINIDRCIKQIVEGIDDK